MIPFPQYYTRLFNGITDALEALQEQNYIKAQNILMSAQQDAEEMYLEDCENEEEDDTEYISLTESIQLINEEKELERQLDLLELQKAMAEGIEALRQMRREGMA